MGNSSRANIYCSKTDCCNNSAKTVGNNCNCLALESTSAYKNKECPFFKRNSTDYNGMSPAEFRQRFATKRCNCGMVVMKEWHFCPRCGNWI